MKVLILTGMLASGKSIALRVLQDLGYYCIDNLPPNLIQHFIDIVNSSNPSIQKIAIVVDARGEVFFSHLDDMLLYLKSLGNCDIVFMDADDEILIQRYKLQRRRHLIAGEERIEETIKRERGMLKPLREISSYIIDTSRTTDDMLREKLIKLFSANEQAGELTLIITSFGFKYGILKDGDIIMDVRFLPNPYYIEDMRERSGLDSDVSDYVLASEMAEGFVSRFEELIMYLVDGYKQEGKKQLVIGIGCSGGFHRSPALAEEIAKRLKESGYLVIIDHRDIGADNHGN
ncbi:MAG: RNase adapter RapZ [Eubacteriaceae bacterium]|nr:RNase adapter RapZ [Eubacteriaceae bacterium]